MSLVFESLTEVRFLNSFAPELPLKPEKNSV